ncbi:uncharacterized protein LOC105924864 [Fundulus heteroclitus]|uniref:uncharacterized protein LOC105924864 n=1 Tax=Fundulus heteroclitus TaxID=8078 RepID=UPI00165AB192|nr:uncharacterized protein LOC105924864 [Fundulus heteroclitus]
MRSDLYQGLDSVSRQRYEEKISAVGADPYLIPATEQKAARHCSTQELPALAYPDIFMFLIQVPGYSAVALKNYQNLEAYRYFLRGWVRSVRLCTQRDKFIITSQVINPEGVDENPHHVWAIIEPNGLVVSAHCTCIVGLEAACSHVAATLFALDAVVRIQQATSSPPPPSSPRSQRSGEPVHNGNFSYPNKRRKTTNEDSGHSKPTIPPPTAEELEHYDSFIRSGVKPSQDVPGSQFTGRTVEQHTNVQLKRWLECRGLRKTGKRAELIER